MRKHTLLQDLQLPNLAQPRREAIIISLGAQKAHSDIYIFR